MASQALIQSGKALYDQQSAQPDLAGAFKEGSKIITDQIDKNKKAELDAKKEEHLQKQMEYKQFLMEQDIEAKTALYHSEKAQVLDLYEDAKERGLVEDIGSNRNEIWRDMATRMKLVENLGDKEKLRGRIDNMMKAEGNWANIVSASDNIAISNSSPEAQQIDYAIAAHNKTNPGVPPPIVEINGKDQFELVFNGEKVYIPVDKALGATDPNAAGAVFGDYTEPITASGIQSKITDAINGDPQLFNAFENGYGDLNQIRRLFRNNLNSPETIKEFGDSLFVQGGLDPSLYSNLDQDGDPSNGIQYNPDALEEIFLGMVEDQFGVQDKQRPLSLQEQQDQADLDYKKSQTAKNLAAANKGGGAENKNLETAFNKFSQGDISAIKGLGGISDVKKNRNGTWEILDEKGNVMATAGSGNVPQGNVVRNLLGLSSDAPNQEGPITEDDAVDRYIAAGSSVPYN